MAKFVSHTFWPAGILVISIGLAAGGELALVRFTESLSFQAVWTALVFSFLAILIALSIREYSRWALLIVGLAASGAVAAALQVTLGSAEVSGVGYLISAGCFGFSYVLSRSGMSRSKDLIWFYWASVFVCIFGPVAIFLNKASDNRILEMTMAFASVFIFVNLELNAPSRFQIILGYLSVALAGFVIFQDGARTAGMLILIASVANLLTGTFGSKISRIVFSSIVFATWSFISIKLLAAGRWAAGDSRGKSKGQSAQLNTNGRVTLANDALATLKDLDLPNFVAQLFLGLGLEQVIGRPWNLCSNLPHLTSSLEPLQTQVCSG